MIIKYFRAVLLLVFNLIAYNNVFGQTPIIEFLAQLKRINNGKHIAYKYQVQYIDEAEHKVVDSVSGRFYKDGLRYLDENNLVLSAYTDGYYCKVEKEKRNVHVYRADLFKKYLGINVTEETSMMVIPDSFILRYGQINIDTSAKGSYIVRINIGLDALDKAVFEIDKKSFLVESARIEMYEQIMSTDKFFRKVYLIRDVSYDYDTNVFNLKRIYRVTNGEVALSKKYKNHNLKTLTK